MKQIHRVGFALFLLASLVLPFSGSYTWLISRLSVARNNAAFFLDLHHDISEEKYVLLSFTLDESKSKLKWEHSREFEYNNQMYDVIRTEQCDDSITYVCYWDRKETQIRKQLDVLVGNLLGSSPQDRNQQSRITEFFRSVYFETTLVPSLICLSSLSRKIVTPYQPFFSDYYPEPAGPPPWGS